MSKGLCEPDLGRVRKVIYRQGEPDGVPFCELFHDAVIIAAIVGRLARAGGRAACPTDPL